MVLDRGRYETITQYDDLICWWWIYDSEWFMMAGNTKIAVFSAGNRPKTGCSVLVRKVGTVQWEYPKSSAPKFWAFCIEKSEHKHWEDLSLWEHHFLKDPSFEMQGSARHRPGTSPFYNLWHWRGSGWTKAAYSSSIQPLISRSETGNDLVLSNYGPRLLLASALIVCWVWNPQEMCQPISTITINNG